MRPELLKISRDRLSLRVEDYPASNFAVRPTYPSKNTGDGTRPEDMLLTTAHVLCIVCLSFVFRFASTSRWRCRNHTGRAVRST
ncbi:hypothetical protein OBBRIDRAFT_797337 [Obba rivulosa]|uniref:Uncharacterized protein n=1 Tax=Obba rivulosa TaxID=1052685 RepID=A0A8E2AN19_9APHY|nr:hypothetical protein OBBRIDRAFT_797337 [Obba rivulosa]